MSDDKHTKDDPERTLVTLDQLSQTIEVMTTVVNRLRRHLSEQIKAQLENQTETQLEAQLEALLEVQLEAEQQNDSAEDAVEPSLPAKNNIEASTPKKESFVIEINQQETDPRRKTTKILH